MAFRLVLLMLHVSVSGVILLSLTRATQLGQHVLEMLQAHDIGVVDQVHRIGHRVDVHLFHAVECLNAILQTARAIGPHVLLQCQGHASPVH